MHMVTLRNSLFYTSSWCCLAALLPCILGGPSLLWAQSVGGVPPVQAQAAAPSQAAASSSPPAQPVDPQPAPSAQPPVAGGPGSINLPVAPVPALASFPQPAPVTAPQKAPVDPVRKAPVDPVQQKPLTPKEAARVEAAKEAAQRKAALQQADQKRAIAKLEKLNDRLQDINGKIETLQEGIANTTGLISAIEEQVKKAQAVFATAELSEDDFSSAQLQGFQQDLKTAQRKLTTQQITLDWKAGPRRTPSSPWISKVEFVLRQF